MTDLPPDSPGQAIQVELERRSWTHDDLARVLGCHRPEVTNLVLGKRSLSAEMALRLSAALGETPSYWLALDAAYSLSKVEQPPEDVRRRAMLFEHAPVKEMERRGWIKPTKGDAELEEELRQFYGSDSLDGAPQLRIAARQSVSADALTSAQVAWCYRAVRLARRVQAASYDRERLVAALPGLRELARLSESVKRVPRFLAEVGVRVVVVERLARTRIDGAAIVVSGAPVIALSLRMDRIDSFWHTLCHEISHVLSGDGEAMVDVDLYDDETRAWSARPDVERRADESAAALLIPRHELDSFILRAKPLYSKTRIVQFANRLKIHPGIVVGQLQHRGEVGFYANREMLAKVRDTFIDRALTDGFGHTPTRG